MRKMKKLFLLVTGLVLTVIAFAQAGLSTGQAVVNPTPTPTQTKKHCPHCGITMGNVTYPWQHETWCPYYRSQGSSSGSSSSISSSVAGAALGTGAAVLGSALSSLITSALDHSNGDNNYYTNDSFGGQISFKTEYYSDDDHTCVVLRDPKTGKKGIWHNAYVFNHKRDPQPTSGFWILQPVFDQIYMSEYMGKPYAITCQTVKAKKGDPKPEWKVYEFGLGNMCYRGHATIISPFPATDVEFSLKYGKMMLQQDGSTWSLYKVDRAGVDELKKHPITLKPLAAPQFDSIQFYGNQNVVWQGGHAGLVDDNGKELIPVKYKDVGTIVGKNKWAWAVADDGNAGLVNSKGEVILPFVHSSIHVDEYGVNARREGESKYFVLLDDGTKTDAIYDDVTFTKDGYVYSVDGLYGFATPKGKKVLDPQFESILLVDYNADLGMVNNPYVGKKVLYVKKNGLWGVAHLGDGSYIIEPLILEKDKVMTYLGKSLQWTDYYMAARNWRHDYLNTKDEFETEAQFQARKADPAANEAYADKKMEGYPSVFLTNMIRYTVKTYGSIDITWHNYDADKGAFPFSSNLSAIPIYYLSVPMADGPAFRQALSSVRTKDMVQTATFFIYQHFAQIAEMDIKLPSGKTYHYKNPGLAGYTGPIVKYSDLY